MRPLPVLPLPIQIVLDDVGWWTGTDGSADGEPFRSGMPRPHVPADYAAITRLGRELGMRPQAAMILCDWDRDLLLRDLPEATWMGANWDNPWRDHPHLDEAARILSDEADHVELVVHGLAHEWWGNRTMERAEWADRDGQMRPRGQLERHLEVYSAILARNGLGPLPDIFVPCAFNHSFGEEDTGIHRLLADYGIRYVSTPYSCMRHTRAPQTRHIAIECGVMTVDRGGGAPSWKTVGASPPGAVEGPIIGLHWPNILHEDAARNDEVIDAWVAALKHIGQAQDRWLAPDTPSAWRQLAHVECTRMTVSAEGVGFDFSRLDALPPTVPLDRFVIKVDGTTAPTLRPGVELVEARPDETGDQTVCYLQRCGR